MVWHRHRDYNSAPMTRLSAGFSKDSETVLSGLLRAGDVLSVALSAGIAYALRAGNLELPGTYISATVLGMLLTANYMHFARVYSLSSLRRQAVEVAKVVAAWVAVFATLVVVSLLTDTSELFSRAWVALCFSFSLGGFLLLRAFAALQIDRWLKSGRLALKIAVVGYGELPVRSTGKCASSASATCASSASTTRRKGPRRRAKARSMGGSAAGWCGWSRISSAAMWMRWSSPCPGARRSGSARS